MSTNFPEYFKKWYEDIKKPAISPVSLEHYSETLKTFVKKYFDMDIRAITRETYQHAIYDFSSHYSKRTVLGVNYRTKSCLDWAVYDGIIPRNPAFKITVPNTTTAQAQKTENSKTISIAEAKKLLNNLAPLCEATHNGWRKGEIAYDSNGVTIAKNPIYMHFDLAIMLALKCGFRFAEVFGLTWDRINLKSDSPTIRIDRTLNYKRPGQSLFCKTKTTSSVRTVAIDSKTVEILSKLKEQQGNPDGSKLIFNELYEIGREKSLTSISDEMCEYLSGLCHHLGIHYIHFHGLRHMHGSILLAEGVPIIAISRRLGHSSINMTQRVYLHELKETKQKSDQMIDNIMEAM